MSGVKDIPTLSVCMITYNHEDFIAEAINGVLMQKTNFPIKLIIGEDSSTDRTREICEVYQKKHPEIIELLPKGDNLGMSKNFIRTLKECDGKYIAFCEGDDYWTYKNKLKEQVYFLERNQAYSICSHVYNILSPDNNLAVDRYSNLVKNELDGLSFDLESHYKYWLAKALTLVIRNDYNYTEELEKYKYTRDSHLIYHVLNNGKGYCINFIGGVYRLHQGGIHSSQTNIQNVRCKLEVYSELLLFNSTDKTLRQKYDEIVKHFFNTIIYEYLSNEISFNDLSPRSDLNKFMIGLILTNVRYIIVVSFKLIFMKVFKYGSLKD